mmetsp:Transcript_149369/g.271502  ORF Transcript_149369/g.271502 Transcript_149369/m.271502 type:complete len:645 (-) Transcript_149369:106-2040(-)
MMSSCECGPASSRTKMSSFVPQANFDFAAVQAKDKEAQVQHNVFNWLDWAPAPASRCYNALHKYFPGALPGPAVHMRINSVLEDEEYSFKVGNTLFGASICPDEINNKVGDLSDVMKSYWGNIFPLGGISGAPFVGTSGFKAFSSHVPENGDIIILFGPHVGITNEGEVGKILRDGQQKDSTACGAVIGAYKACANQNAKTAGEEFDFNELDMQIEWIKTQLEPHIQRIQAQANPMAALAYQAYEMVKAKLSMIVNTDFGSGRLVLVGGIQINMPTPWRDHFLPLTFEVHQKGRRTKDLLDAFECKLITELPEARRLMRMIQPDARKAITPDAKRAPAPASKAPARKGSFVCEANFDHTAEKVHDEEAVNQHLVWSWLTWSPEIFSPCYNALHKEFPGALPGPGVHHRVMMTLTRDYGFTPDNTLFGNSICSDEINNTPQSLSALMACYWGAVFPMGGLGGVPFAGKTGFKAFSAHVPDNGNIVILYGPHVGVSEFGEVGKILRKGQDHDSTACGAVIGAYHASCAQKSKEDVEFDETDMQMGWIKHQIQAHSESISKQECPLAALAYQAFELVKNKINKVVDTNFGSGRLVLIGGIQINLTPPYNDHFLPLSFEVRQAGKPTENIIKAFDIPMPQVATEWVEI